MLLAQNTEPVYSLRKHTTPESKCFVPSTLYSQENHRQKRVTEATHPDDYPHALALISEGEDLEDGEVQDVAAWCPQLHGGLVSAHQC